VLVREGVRRGVRVAYQLTIEYGDDVLLSAAMSRAQFDDQARFLLAAKLFEMGKLSSGQAARLCGKDRVSFLLSLSGAAIPAINLDVEELEHDLRFGRGE